MGNKKIKGAVQSGDPDQVVSAIMDLLQGDEDLGTYTEDAAFQHGCNLVEYLEAVNDRLSGCDLLLDTREIPIENRTEE